MIVHTPHSVCSMRGGGRYVSVDLKSLRSIPCILTQINSWNVLWMHSFNIIKIPSRKWSPPPNEELGNGHSGLGLPKTFNGYVVITLGVVQKKDRIALRLLWRQNLGIWTNCQLYTNELFSQELFPLQNQTRSKCNELNNNSGTWKWEGEAHR